LLAVARIAEKNYVAGWLLKGIYNNPAAPAASREHCAILPGSMAASFVLSGRLRSSEFDTHE